MGKLLTSLGAEKLPVDGCEPGGREESVLLLEFWGFVLCFEKGFSEVFVAECFTEQVSSFECVLESNVADVEPYNEERKGHEDDKRAPVENAKEGQVQKKVLAGA